MLTHSQHRRRGDRHRCKLLQNKLSSVGLTAVRMSHGSRSARPPDHVNDVSPPTNKTTQMMERLPSMTMEEARHSCVLCFEWSHHERIRKSGVNRIDSANPGVLLQFRLLYDNSTDPFQSSEWICYLLHSSIWITRFSVLNAVFLPVWSHHNNGSAPIKLQLLDQVSPQTATIWRWAYLALWPDCM